MFIVQATAFSSQKISRFSTIHRKGRLKKPTMEQWARLFLFIYWVIGATTFSITTLGITILSIAVEWNSASLCNRDKGIEGSSSKNFIGIINCNTFSESLSIINVVDEP